MHAASLAILARTEHVHVKSNDDYSLLLYIILIRMQLLGRKVYR